MIVCSGQRRPGNMGVRNVPADSDFLSWAVANARHRADFGYLGLFMYGCHNLRSSRFYVLIDFFTWISV